MKLNLLYQFNEKYAPYAGISIFSLLINNQDMEEICFYILGEGLSEEAKGKIENLVLQYHREIVFVETDVLIAKMKKLDLPTYRGSYAANMRMFVDEVIDESVDRILYLDSDTVIDGSLSELAGADLHGKTIGMVLDSLGGFHKYQIGLSEQDDYFNSGVILFDLRRWREKEYSKKIVSHVMNQRNNYPSPDQDLLNVICHGDIARLDMKYNFQPIHTAFSGKQYMRVMRPDVYYSLEQIEWAKEHTVIFHCFRFLGEFPWHRNNLHPFDQVFERYLRKSPWKDYEKKEAEAGMIIRIEKVLYRVLPASVFLPVFKIAHALFIYRANRDALKNKTHKLM